MEKYFHVYLTGLTVLGFEAQPAENGSRLKNAAGMSAPPSRRALGVKVPSRRCPLLVAEGNCVVARRGGEQPEANMQSVG